MIPLTHSPTHPPARDLTITEVARGLGCRPEEVPLWDGRTGTGIKYYRLKPERKYVRVPPEHFAEWKWRNTVR